MVGGVCWGFSGTCGQYPFSRYGVSSLWLTCLRLLCGGIIMLALAAVHHRRDLLRIWRSPADAAMLVCYGVFGLMMCQYAYMTSISYSNAGQPPSSDTEPGDHHAADCLRLRRRPNGWSPPLWSCHAGHLPAGSGGDQATWSSPPRGCSGPGHGGGGDRVHPAAPAAHDTVEPGGDHRWGMLIGGAILNLGAAADLHTDLRSGAGWRWGHRAFGTVLLHPVHAGHPGGVGAVKSSLLAATEPVSATIFSPCAGHRLLGGGPHGLRASSPHLLLSVRKKHRLPRPRRPPLELRERRRPGCTRTPFLPQAPASPILLAG
jgi:hypothetical protein